MIGRMSMATALVLALAAGVDPVAFAKQPSQGGWSVPPLPADPADEEVSRVLGGLPVPIDDFPWQVALILSGRPIYEGQFCGGTLIADRWVLTAAHCVVTSGLRALPDSMVVYSGSADLRGGGTTTPIQRIYVHPGYVSLTDQHVSDNDIALVELVHPIEGPTMRLATPANDPSLVVPGQPAVVTGWGRTDASDPRISRIFGTIMADSQAAPLSSTSGADDLHYPSHLMEGSLPIVDNDTCAASLEEPGLADSVMCAGIIRAGIDSCQGDSGGPLQVQEADGQYTQVGLVSWGPLCDSGGGLGVYTRVAAYSGWITDVMAGHEDPRETDHRVNVDPAFYGTISLVTDFQPDPYHVEMEASGSNEASWITPECAGFIAEEPDYTLEFTAGQYPLFISASSETDTVIVVVDPDGQIHCSDDYDSDVSFNPAVSFDHPQSGDYQVWVGTYDYLDGYPSADLFVSEIEPQF